MYICIHQSAREEGHASCCFASQSRFSVSSSQTMRALSVAFFHYSWWWGFCEPVAVPPAHAGRCKWRRKKMWDVASGGEKKRKFKKKLLHIMLLSLVSLLVVWSASPSLPQTHSRARALSLHPSLPSDRSACIRWLKKKPKNTRWPDSSSSEEGEVFK